MKGLTEKQKRVLAVIREHLQTHGKPPTVREIGRTIGVASSCTTQRHLDALVKKGFITRTRWKYRSISIVGEVYTADERIQQAADERIRQAVNEALERAAQACAGLQVSNASVRYADVVRSFKQESA